MSILRRFLVCIFLCASAFVTAHAAEPLSDHDVNFREAVFTVMKGKPGTVSFQGYMSYQNFKVTLEDVAKTTDWPPSLIQKFMTLSEDKDAELALKSIELLLKYIPCQKYTPSLQLMLLNEAVISRWPSVRLEIFKAMDKDACPAFKIPLKSYKLRCALSFGRSDEYPTIRNISEAFAAKNGIEKNPLCAPSQADEDDDAIEAEHDDGMIHIWKSRVDPRRQIFRREASANYYTIAASSEILSSGSTWKYNYSGLKNFLGTGEWGQEEIRMAQNAIQSPRSYLRGLAIDLLFDQHSNRSEMQEDFAPQIINLALTDPQDEVRITIYKNLLNSLDRPKTWLTFDANNPKHAELLSLGLSSPVLEIKEISEEIQKRIKK